MKKIKASVRPRFPEDEKKHPWLSMLLDAYALIDKGISFAVKEKEKGGAKWACKKGCDICCRAQKDIPIYPLEMVGIYWYATEKVAEPLRAILKNHLLNYRNEKRCPFLIDNSCSVHPIRPIGCRQFNVLNRPCREGEDPYYTRKQDILLPVQSYSDRAFLIMLPFYGITDEKTKSEIIRTRLIHSKARVLQSLNWSDLAKKMEEFDNRPS